MRIRCLKCGESHRTNECPIKDKIQNPLCINCNKTGHMANWSQCENSPEKTQKKVKRFATVTPLPNLTKPQKVTPNRSFAAALSQALRNKTTPGTPAATEETPSINENSNDKRLWLQRRDTRTQKIFLDYPFLLEMGRQFSYAKDEERLDIFYQNLVKIKSSLRPLSGKPRPLVEAKHPSDSRAQNATPSFIFSNPVLSIST
ncbi:hypothetical protein TNCV_1018091 [Trichonephila clavipes]|nr:hypothetical protein TNCV_1018091 [Trichonephila clavipes]